MILKINTVALVGVGVGDGGDNRTRVYQSCTPALYSQQPWPVFLRVLAPAHTAPRYACSRLLCGGSPYLNRWLTFPLSKTKGRLFHNTNGSRVEHDEQQRPILHEWSCSIRLAILPMPAQVLRRRDHLVFTSVQKAISLAKGFATRSCHWTRHLNTRYPGMEILKTKAPEVLLRCIDGTDAWQFDQLVGELRNSRSVSRPGFLSSSSHFYSMQL